MDLRHTLLITSGPATLLALILQIPLILASAPALALGLGNASLKTALGYPLTVNIPILDPSASLDVEQVRVRQVLGFDAKEMGYDLAANAEPFSISVSELASGLTIQVKSPAPLLEPFVSFVLELSWPGGTLYRDYNLLVDLPPAVPPIAAAAPAQPTGTTARPPGLADPADTSTQWRVAPGENLWRIARRVQPDRSIPLDTVMAVIHARNPHAFLNGDMNRLQAGALLDLPSDADYYSAPPAVASLPAAAAPRPAGREPSPPTVETASPAAHTEETPQGRLRLSGSPAETSGSRAVRLRKEIDAIKEQLDKVNRENQQLRQQIQRIEGSEYLAVMQKMLQLQEQRIVELKAQLRTDAAKRAEAGSAGGISAPAAPAVPAPVVVRDAGPSYATVLLLILAGIIGGVALSQLQDWWQKRRTAAKALPERQAFSFDSLTTHWGGEFPAPAPEPHVSEAEESGLAAAGGEKKDLESADGPATSSPASIFKELELDELFDQDSADLSAQTSTPGDDDLVLDFAAFDQATLDGIDPAAARPPALDAAESGDADVKSTISEESGLAAAGGEKEGPESVGRPATSGPDSLVGELQLDEPFGQDFGDLSAQSSTPSGDYLVLDFAAIDQLPREEIDPAAAEPSPDAAESGDADVKNAINKAVV